MAITTEPAAAQGPSIAFDDFYSDMWPHAFRLAAFLTHDTQAGEDVAQEVLTAMSQRLGPGCTARGLSATCDYQRQLEVDPSSSHRHAQAPAARRAQR